MYNRDRFVFTARSEVVRNIGTDTNATHSLQLRGGLAVSPKFQQAEPTVANESEDPAIFGGVGIVSS